MQLRRSLSRSIVLACLALIMLGLAVSSNQTSQAVSSSGPLYIWGYNNYGQLGNGSTNIGYSPNLVILPNGATATKVGGGLSFSLAIGNNGKIYSWGRNNFGQLGDGTYINRTTPVVVNNFPAGVTPLTIDGGQGHVVVSGSDGKLYAWGYNISGQLGNGTYNDSLTPVVVNLPAGVSPTTVTVGYNQNMAIGSDNKLYVWGYNGYGQLGDGTYNDTDNPTVITLTTGVTPVAISGRGFHSMAIGSDNKLYTWGRNDYGQLGNGTTLQTNTPGAISLPGGVIPTAISANYYHSAAIGNDGKVYTWGRNDFGQLGNGTTTNSNIPVMITLPNGATALSIATNLYNTYALGSDGKLYAWGNNSNGQLGIGTTLSTSTTPVAVALPAGATLYNFGTAGYNGLVVLSNPTFNVNNVAQAEGNSGTSSFNFTVSLSYATSQTVTVNYATTNGSATAPTDYTATSGTLTFAPGTVTQTVAVGVNGNTTIEPNKTFNLTLSNPSSGATLGTATGTGTILNDDDSTTLTSDPNPSFVGQSVIFTATVSPITATGTVSFTEGATILGTGTLSSGVATYTTNALLAGSHSIVASYAGDNLFSPSTSSAITQVVNLNPTTLTLAGPSNPSTVGQSVTFTATVNPITADGTVTFTEGATVLGSVVLSSGKAIFTTTSLNLGSHAISATYAGNNTYAGSTSNTVTQVVNLNNTTLTLTSDPNPSLVGQSVTFTATVSSVTASGVVSFTIDNGAAIPVTLSGGVATYVTTTLTAGTHTASATYGGDSAYAGSSAQPLTQTVNLNSSSLNLTSNPNPSLVGQSVTFTATVSPTAASGIVTFTEGATVLGTASLSGGSAVYSTTSLVAGSHVISATYGGDSTYAGVSSASVTQVVNLNNTTTSLTSSPNPSLVGQSVTFTATVSPAASGVVSFTIDNGVVIPVTLSGGVATYVTTTLTAGSHSVIATYGGNGTYAPSTSAILTQVVELNIATLSLTSSPNPSVFNQTATFTATVSPTAASGTVTFTEGATVLGTASLVSGSAVFTTPNLIVGSHTVSATYGGNSTYAAANSNTVTQVVNCPLAVTAITDDGTGTTCGTLSYALSQPITGSTPVTITFALTQGNTITFTGSLTITAKVKAGVVIYGGAFGSSNRIILNGNGVAGDGLHLSGNNYLVNLTIEHFGGKELTLESSGNRLQGVVVDAF